MGPNMGRAIDENSIGSKKLRLIPIPASLQSRGVAKIAVSKNAQVVLSKEGRVYVHGVCENTIFGFVGPHEYMEKFHEFKDFPVAEGDQIVDVSIGK